MSATAVRGAWQRQQRTATVAILLLPVIVLALLFALPMLQLIGMSFTKGGVLSFDNYVELTRPVYARLTLYTFQLALLITALCLVVGYPVAYLIANVGGGLSRLIVLFLVLSLWLSVLTRTYGWVALLQRNGVINNFIVAAGFSEKPLTLLYNPFGVAVGMLHLLLPFMVVTLLPVMRAVDVTQLRAGLSLGASPLRVFLRIFLPLTLPGVAAGAILVFIMALGYFVTPAILGGGRSSTIAMAIENQVLTLVDLPLAAATSVALLVLSVAALLLYERFSGVDRIFGGRADA
jgi:ABC-type spermidine/putrescine transport system permease subunit I